MAVSPCDSPAALGTDGGWSKVQSRTWRMTACPPIRRFFSCFSAFPDVGAMIAGTDGRGEVSRPAGVLAKPNAATPRFQGPCQPVPSTHCHRAYGHAPGPDFRRIIFPFSARLSGMYVWKGNNGNMGTSYFRQAENRASGACERVPKHSDGFGNMGTEMADPDAGKSARVWLPPAPPAGERD